MNENLEVMDMERLTHKTGGKYSNTIIEQAPPYSIDCDVDTAITKLAEYEDLEEQGKLPKLPYAVGDEVFVITKCKNIPQQLDGTLYNDDGSFGDATGYYCPYEDNCPFDGDDFEDCEKCENKNAIFDDTVSHIDIYETGITVFTENCNEAEFISAFCEDGDKHIFSTKEQAESALQKMNEREGKK